jgi:hypothetical protein
MCHDPTGTPINLMVSKLVCEILSQPKEIAMIGRVRIRAEWLMGGREKKQKKD